QDFAGGIASGELGDEVVDSREAVTSFQENGLGMGHGSSFAFSSLKGKATTLEAGLATIFAALRQGPVCPGALAYSWWASASSSARAVWSYRALRASSPGR